MITDSTQQAIAMVLAGAGRALADCAGEAQPKRWLLHLPLKRVNRNDLRAGAQNEGEPALTRYSLMSVKCSRETAYAGFFPRPIHIQTLPTPHQHEKSAANQAITRCVLGIKFNSSGRF